MMPTPFSRTPEEMEESRAFYRERERQLDERRAARAVRAWEIARQYAATLRDEYGATRVDLFGSLARGTFGLRSDIDLAAWGLTNYFGAVGAMFEGEDGIRVDIVPMEQCREYVRPEIERDGIRLV